MKKISAGKIAAIGAGAVALGATAYYFLGPKGGQHQKSAKKWVVEAKKKIIKEIQKQKTMTKSLYENIVDDVLTSYKVKGVTAGEALAFAKTLKKDWKYIVQASKERIKQSATKAKKKVSQKAKAGKKAN